jgi:hypothetical protein
MILQVDVSPDAPKWPLWPFLILAGLLVLPGVSVILLGVLAWLKAPQREVKEPTAPADKVDSEKPNSDPQ